MKRKICALLALLMIAVVLTGCGLGEPRPEIKKGEFDFSVTYEHDGEIKTLSGVYVCEFDGIDWVIDGGYHREWKGHIKDNTIDQNIVLEIAEDGGVVELYLAFDPGHFMGDSHWEGDEPFVPCLSVKIEDDEGMYFENDVDLIAENYGVRIISYEYEQPIENSFTKIGQKES